MRPCLAVGEDKFPALFYSCPALNPEPSLTGVNLTKDFFGAQLPVTGRDFDPESRFGPAGRLCFLFQGSAPLLFLAGQTQRGFASHYSTHTKSWRTLRLLHTLNFSQARAACERRICHRCGASRRISWPLSVEHSVKNLIFVTHAYTLC